MAVYLDNAATSWPKPPSVLVAMQEYLCQGGGSPGRSSHGKALDSARRVYQARELLAQLFGAASAERIIFAKNATEAINMILFGLLEPGDHVITSAVEHNAVMRPLRELEKRGVSLSIARCDSQGRLDPDEVEKAIRPKTRLIFVVHASNVSGTIQPIEEIGAIARRHGIRFAVDAAQTAGVCPIDTLQSGIDFLAFTGHKSLGGPQGTGGLVLGPTADLKPLIFGGTGSASESELQPDFLPDKLESGTLNALGIVGLVAALEDLNRFGIEKILPHEHKLIRQLREGVSEIAGVRLYAPDSVENAVGVLSLNIGELPCEEVGYRLEHEFGILTRTGLHCAPAAHRSLGSYERGTVRFSVSRFNTAADIQNAIIALNQIANNPG